MGIVYHANYLIWFEAGRGDFFRALGQDYGRWEYEGFYLPVSEAFARYHAPARYGELVTVSTRVDQVRSRAITLEYEVHSADSGTLLASGWTKHICTDRQGHARRLPQAMFEALENQ
jgi:acyl-CoA thioester hydrolase